VPTKYFEILESFDGTKHEHAKTTPSILKCLELFKKGDIISPKQFAEANVSILNKRSAKLNATLYTVDRSIKIAKDLGLIQLVDDKPITLKDFYALDSVQYFISQLRGSKLKNLKTDGLKENTTRRSYVQQLYHFNNWLHGKTFEFSTTKQIDIDIFKKTKEKVTLEGVEHLLQLFQNSYNVDSEYIKVVKLFLMDQHNSKCSAKYMSVKHSAITSYFEKNDSPLRFKYNPFNNHEDYKEENSNAVITLDEVHKMCSKANPLEKAVVLCRFHRGLDSSTFADRFNFQAWQQLVQWFGHTDYENWDLTKCPVPIRITRVKTNYLHTGYLERDAIVAIQDYLNYRYQLYLRMCKRQKIDGGYVLEKTQLMQNDKPLFVTKENKAVSINWVSRVVPRLATNAGIQKVLKGNRLQNKSEKIGHELRDLLKSTLIVSGTADYVCQLAIGHTVNDSYEKQDKLYPENSRAEYAKASNRINIFSKVSNYLNNGDDTEKLQNQITILESKYDKQQNDMTETVDKMVKESIAKVFDSQMISEEKVQDMDYQRGLKIKLLEKKLGDKYQKEKEVLDNIHDMATASGKSFVEMMADLIKSKQVKAEL